MDLNHHVVTNRPEGQNHDRIDAEMEDSGPSSSVQESEVVGTTNALTNSHEAAADEMDITPDAVHGEVERRGQSPLAASASNEPVSTAAGVDIATSQTNGTAVVEDSVSGPAADTEDLVRDASDSSSTTGGQPSPFAPLDVQEILAGITTEVGVVAAPGLGDVVVPPPPPPANPPDPERDDDEETPGDEEDPWWTELVEDPSGPDEEELKEIEQAGAEISALDRKCGGEFVSDRG